MSSFALLNRLSAYTKTDVTYLFQKGGWVLCNQVATLLCGLAMSIAFANLLTPHDYGIYKYILAVSALIGALKLTGLRQSTIQSVATGHHGTVFLAIRTSLLWTIPMILIGSATAAYYTLHENSVLGIGIIIGTLVHAVSGTLGLYDSYLSGIADFKKSSLLKSLQIFITAIFVILGLYVEASALLLVCIYGAVSILTTSLYAFVVLKKVARKSQSSQQSLRFGKHLSVQGIFVTASLHADKIILFQFLGSVELAKFAFATLLPDQMRSIIKNVFSIVVPKYAIKDRESLRASIRSKVFKITATLLVPIGLYWLLAPWLFATLFPDYIDVVLYSRLFALDALLLPAIALLSMYFHVLEQTTILYYSKIINACSRVAIITAGIVYAGLLGAIIGHLIARVVQIVIFVWFYKKA